jgi:hypothetical protein
MKKELNLTDIRRYVNEDKAIVECELACKECKYIKDCLKIDSEILLYKVDSDSFGADLINKSVILPLIGTPSDINSRKVYAVLIEMQLASILGKKWNALDVAKNLNVSVYKIRQRIAYLIDNKYISKEKNKYIFSLSKVTAGVIRHYCAEFKARFGVAPIVTAMDAGAVTDIVKNYSDSDLHLMISKYFETKDDFIVRNGYALRFFPSRINVMLMEFNEKTKSKPAVFTQTQLDAYIAGKKEGKWDGITESWSKPYEDAINANSKTQETTI